MPLVACRVTNLLTKALLRLEKAFVNDWIELPEYEERVAAALRSDGGSEKPWTFLYHSTESGGFDVCDYRWRNPEWR